MSEKEIEAIRKRVVNMDLERKIYGKRIKSFPLEWTDVKKETPPLMETIFIQNKYGRVYVGHIEEDMWFLSDTEQESFEIKEIKSWYLIK